LKDGFALRLAEFRDVRARKEGAAPAGHDNRLDAVVGEELAERLVDPVPHRMAECVDGRVVGQDDAHVPCYRDGDFLIDLRHVGLQSAFEIGAASKSPVTRPQAVLGPLLSRNGHSAQ
jgi:hypothetical protein